MRSYRWLFVLAVIFVVVLSGCGKAAEEERKESGDTKVTMVLEGASGTGKTVEVYLIGDRALEVREGEVAAVFDLTAATWKDVKQQRTGSLAEGIAWAAERTQLARETLAAEEDSPTRAFRASLVDPQFVVEEGAGMVVIKNDYNMYRVAPAELPAETVRAFLQYDRLNAYRTTMLRNQFPPAVQLGITTELESRGIAPKSMYIETSGGSPITLTYTYESLSKEDAAKMQEWLAD